MGLVVEWLMILVLTPKIRVRISALSILIALIDFQIIPLFTQVFFSTIPEVYCVSLLRHLLYLLIFKMVDNVIIDAKL